jgi:hypothetical protein
MAPIFYVAFIITRRIVPGNGYFTEGKVGKAAAAIEKYRRKDFLSLCPTARECIAPNAEWASRPCSLTLDLEMPTL